MREPGRALISGRKGAPGREREKGEKASVRVASLVEREEKVEKEAERVQAAWSVQAGLRTARRFATHTTTFLTVAETPGAASSTCAGPVLASIRSTLAGQEIGQRLKDRVQPQSSD